MANLKSIKLGTSIRYELLLIFERFRGFRIKEIIDKLNKAVPGKYAAATVYRYHARYARADRKVRELTRGW